MNSDIILPNLNYSKLTYDSVFSFFYGRKFRLIDLNTLELIIRHMNENYPSNEDIPRLVSWHSALRNGFAMRGEL
ncbi:hypothetical protein [Aeromonas phage AS-yj]|uniref:Uncharacterized protein n=2 Tax=Ceceduovirus aszj TaxID=2843652 RepID=A0A223LGB4_9CAUD|nr:hypothetical protein HWB28_gp023 [Aeromonas phage AS-zj]ASU00529.1 hypothetical protein [Aeromonas phage AS-zj]ATI18043.1 hypothetical protein [Aeromonas phage AS-yj]QAX99041.1 hypothetical protein assk_252 [Aeromonas phage Assk]